MGRIATTIQLAKASWRVLRADKELLALPVMSGAATLVVVISFILPIVATGGIGDGAGPASFVLGGVLYLALAYVTIFFNAALVHAADERLRGGDPTLRSALAGAWARKGRILGWALVSATVSVVLRAIEERAGFLGRIVSGILGVAWSLVTFLVVPVLVLEDVGVVEGIKRAGALFRGTWGENVAARVGFGILGFLAALPAIAVVVLGGSVGAGAFAISIGVAFLWVAVVTVVLSALNGIFQTALYHYAVDGNVPGDAFPAEAFSQAFVPRRGISGIV